MRPAMMHSSSNMIDTPRKAVPPDASKGGETSTRSAPTMFSPSSAAHHLQRLIGIRSAHLRRAGAGREGRIDEVDVIAHIGRRRSPAISRASGHHVGDPAGVEFLDRDDADAVRFRRNPGPRCRRSCRGCRSAPYAWGPAAPLRWRGGRACRGCTSCRRNSCRRGRYGCRNGSCRAAPAAPAPRRIGSEDQMIAPRRQRQDAGATARRRMR